MRTKLISLILTLICMYLLRGFYIFQEVEGIAVDYKLVIIFITFLYVVFVKLVGYFARLKIIENNSRIDIVFMIAVMSFMLVPMLKINKDEVNTKERRFLAEYYSFIEGGKINYNYGSDFEDWFNDRFNGRDWFIKRYNKIDKTINGKVVSQHGMSGEDGWLYLNADSSIDIYQHDNLFNQKDLDVISQNLDNFERWGKLHDVKIYVHIVPDKESVYPEYYPDNYFRLNDISRTDQLLQLLSGRKYINYIYTLDALLEKKKEEVVYYKTGSHWNYVGALSAYESLFSLIKQDFPNLRVLGPDDFNVIERVYADVDIANLMGIDAYKEYPESELQDKFFAPKDTNYSQTEINYEDAYKGFLYSFVHHGNIGAPKAFVMTDSYYPYIQDYAVNSFSEQVINFIGFGNNFVFEEEMSDIINDLEPDILIISSAERFLHRFLFLNTPREK